MNDRKITNARFIQVNQMPQIDTHSTAKLYVDNDFNNNNLTNINSITLKTQAVNDDQVNTKAYVDQFDNDNESTRLDLGLDFYDESKDLVKNNQENDLNDNKLTNVNSITVNRNPTLDNEVANKKYIDDLIEEGSILRFNQTLQNYLEVSLGNDIYHLTKYDKIQVTDTTVTKYPNRGGYLLQNWVIKCNDENNAGKIQNFVRSTKTNSPTADSGATSLPPIGDSFMYVETSSNNHSNNVFVIFERTDIIQISKITLL